MKPTIILFLAVALVGCNKPKANEPVQEKPDPKTAQVEEKKVMGPVYAHKIWNDYLSDNKEAKKTYSGKDIQVVGHVWDVEKTGGKVVMFFYVTDFNRAETDNHGVQATFTPPVGYGDLERGDRVLFQGRCNGKALGSINFGNCQFIRKLGSEE